VTEYLNYEGGKFSKSRGTGVFGNDAKDTGIPSEVWRYYLLVNRPESQDTDFNWDDLASKCNSELSNNLGNFINRALSFCKARYAGAIPARHASADEHIAALSEQVSKLVSEYVDYLERKKIKDGIKTAMAISKLGNQYLQDRKHWEVYKTDPAAAGGLLLGSLGLTAVLAALLRPYMPSLTRKILAQMDLDEEEFTRLDAGFVERTRDLAACVPQGHVIGDPSPLFKAIPADTVAELRARYGGNQAENAAAAAAAGDKGADKRKGGADKKGADKKAAPKKKEDPNRPVDFSRVDVRVGQITKVWKHPDAESLYVEEVDLGEGQPRQVVSGLVKYVPEEQMRNRRVVCVCNLKPAKMRGVMSQAMVLCGENADASVVEIVDPPAGAQVGERVTVEGFGEGEPDEQLAPKKKIFEEVAADCTTDAARAVTYKGRPLRTSAGPCTLATLTGAKIR